MNIIANFAGGAAEIKWCIIYRLDICSICRIAGSCSGWYEFLQQYVAQIKFVNEFHIPKYENCSVGIVYWSKKTRLGEKDILLCLSEKYHCVISIKNNARINAVIAQYTWEAPYPCNVHHLVIEEYDMQDHISGICKFWVFKCVDLDQLTISINESGIHTFRDGKLINKENMVAAFSHTIWMYREGYNVYDTPYLEKCKF